MIPCMNIKFSGSLHKGKQLRSNALSFALMVAPEVVWAQVVLILDLYAASRVRTVHHKIDSLTRPGSYTGERVSYHLCVFPSVPTPCYRNMYRLLAHAPVRVLALSYVVSNDVHLDVVFRVRCQL